VSSCTVDEVQYCLEESATDLGSAGKDEYYGYGLIQMQGAYSCLINDVKCCSTGNAASPVEAPAPSPDDQRDCPSSQSDYQLCLIQKLSTAEAALCRSCVNNRIPFNVFASSCDYLHSEICPAVHDDCTDCQACVAEIDFYLTCAVRDINGCDLNCDGGNGITGPASSPDENGNVFNNPAPSPSASAGDDTCEAALEDMRECFVLNEAVVAPTLLRSLSNSNETATKDAECESCYVDAISGGRFGEISCSGGNAALCPAIEQCGCQMCRLETDRYISCMVRKETGGSCQAACVGSTSSASTCGFGALVLVGLFSVAAFLV